MGNRIPNLNGLVRMVGKGPGKIKDRDGDGVPDMLDCNPRNPNQQGVVHDVVSGVKSRVVEARAARKVAVGKRKEFRAEARTAQLEEERKQTIETAKARVKSRAERQRRRIKVGTLQQATASFGQIRANIRGRTARRPKTIKIKKGKKLKLKRKKRVRLARPAPRSVLELI